MNSLQERFSRRWPSFCREAKDAPASIGTFPRAARDDRDFLAEELRWLEASERGAVVRVTGHFPDRDAAFACNFAFSATALDSEDFWSELHLALLEAMVSYRPGKPTTSSALAELGTIDVLVR